MLRRAADMVDVILPQFLLEGRFSAPRGVLPTIVGQHLLGLAVFAHRTPINLQHIFRRVATVDPQAHNVPGVVIQEGDDVRHLPEDVVVRDVALPHLIRRSTLEPAGRHLSPVTGFSGWLHQPGVKKLLPDLPRTGAQAEPLSQHLRDPSHTLPGLGGLQRHDRLPHRFRQGFRTRPPRGFLQSSRAMLPVLPDPLPHHCGRNPDLPGHRFLRNPFLQVQLHGSPPHLYRIRMQRTPATAAGLPRPLFWGLGIRERTPRGRMPLRSPCLFFRFHR